MERQYETLKNLSRKRHRRKAETSDSKCTSCERLVNHLSESPSRVSYQLPNSLDCHSRAVLPRKCSDSVIHDSSTWQYMLVWLLSVLVYINGLNGNFVHDDLSAITSNADVTGTNPVWHIFLNDYWGKPLSHPLSHKSYRPFTILTFRFTHYMMGMTPYWFHLGNITLHSIVTVLYCKMLRKLLSAHLALIPSLLFAVHPIHTEAVSGIVGRADLLAAVSLLLTILKYHESSKDYSSKRGVLMAAFWTLIGTLCKEQAVTGLSICMLWDVYLHQQMLKRYWKHLMTKHFTETQNSFYLSQINFNNNNPNFTNHNLTDNEVSSPSSYNLQQSVIFSEQTKSGHRAATSRYTDNNFSVSDVHLFIRRIVTLSFSTLLIVTFRVWMLKGSSPDFSDQDNPASFSPDLTTRVLTFLYLPALNVWLLICPDKLSYDWQMGSVPLITSAADHRNAFSLLFYATLFMLAYKTLINKGCEGRSLCLSLALLVIPFLPATNLFVRVGFVLAERILYIPSMGYCLLIGLGLQKLDRRKGLLVFFLVLLHSSKTIRRNDDWHSRETLFISGLKTIPHNAKMHYNYANLQKDWNNKEKATFHYREAIRLWPDHASAHNNLATLLTNSYEAEHHYLEALKAHPQHTHANFNLASLRLNEGNTEEAIHLLKKSLQWDPQYRDALRLLAELYAFIGRKKDAYCVYQRLLVTSRENADVINNYPSFLDHKGRKEAAFSHYESVLSLQEENSDALMSPSRLLAKLKHKQGAEFLNTRSHHETYEDNSKEKEELGEDKLEKEKLEDDKLEEKKLEEDKLEKEKLEEYKLEKVEDKLKEEKLNEDELQEYYLEEYEQKDYKLGKSHFIYSQNRLPMKIQLALILQVHVGGISISHFDYGPKNTASYLLETKLNRSGETLNVEVSASKNCSGDWTACEYVAVHKAHLVLAQYFTEPDNKSDDVSIHQDGTLSNGF